MRIAVAGGTGVVGRLVAASAKARGHDVTLLTRGAGVDLTTGAGLERALNGIDAVIDTANTNSLNTKRATRFFTLVSQNLLQAESAKHVKHHVALSIVGIDGIDASYYAGKLAQEQTVADSSVPHTIARAAQFHEFADQILQRVPAGPLAVVPRILMRPIAAAEVAEHLVSIAENEPVRRAPDLVGPREEELAELVRKLLKHRGKRRFVVEVPLPGTYGRGIASGALRGDASALHGTLTFDAWLEQSAS